MEENDVLYEQEILDLLDYDESNRNSTDVIGEISDQVPLVKDVGLKSTCPHHNRMNDLCTDCGKRMNDATDVALGYKHKDLRRLRNVDVMSLLHRKKLCLVLDLDHTLLNSSELKLDSKEAYLMSQVDSSPDISKGSLFLLRDTAMITKLRPYVRIFLQEASKMFEMYIYTMGEKSYALELANLLDPDRLYFDSRINSQADCTETLCKGLDVVLGTQNAVLILDDTARVWPKDKDNLILMKKYLYFSSSCKQLGLDDPSLSVLRTDENETCGTLATILGVLKKIHGKFFDVEHGDYSATRDVRQILQEIRKETLRNCKIVFSGVVPKNVKADNHVIWNVAQQLGATCSTQLDSTVTHVVSGNAGTEKSRWAIKNGKFLVAPGWLADSYYIC